MTQTASLDHETSDVTLEKLLEIERTQQRALERPKFLPLEKLRVATEVFQWRNFDSELEAEERHVKELVRVLEANEEPLDAILLTIVGESFFVVDGHHRLLAYRRAQWKQPIPVEYFDGTVEEARREALRLNIKNKLPMTQQDKFEAAWKLAKEGSKEGARKLSKKQIREITTISERTIATMRQILRDHPGAIDEKWSRAKRLQFGLTDDGDFDQETWLEEKALKMAEQLLKNVGPFLTQRPDITARALALIDSKLPRALIEEWPQEVREFNAMIEEFEF